MLVRVERRSTPENWNLWPTGRAPTRASVRSGPIRVTFEKCGWVNGVAWEVELPSLSDSKPLVSPVGSHWFGSFRPKANWMLPVKPKSVSN